MLFFPKNAQFFLFPLLILRGVAAVAAPVFNSVTPVSTTVATYEKFEVSVNLTASFSNAYNYDDVALTAVFTAPNGAMQAVDGFFMQNFTLNTSDGSISSGSSVFKVRFAPTQIGNWQYALTCTDASGATTYATQNFTCTAATSKGFIRKNATHYLGFDNGEQYIPVGQNQAWQNGNRYVDYKNWLDKLAAQNANHVRIWMSDWAFALEWQNGNNSFSGLRQYKQSNAFYLDWLFDYAAAKGVAMMLCLNHHGQVSTSVNAEWYQNPYYSGNGGPCSATIDFFTNTSAKATMKNRLRYIVARWGYARNLMSWELFNEVDFTDNYSSYQTQVRDWHDEMATFIRSKDPNSHLISTSFGADSYGSSTWQLANMDFTQSHVYDNVPTIEKLIVEKAADKLTTYSKPTICGEMSIALGNGLVSGYDPAGVHLHNSIWASLFSGAMGSAMTWWWDEYVEPRNLYPFYKPAADFVATLPLKNSDFRPTTPSVSGGSSYSTATVTPALDFSTVPTVTNFTLNSNGTLTPSASNLARYIHGSDKSNLKAPPTFAVNYPIAGQFRLTVASVSSYATQRVNIYLDGTLLVDAAATVSTFSINVSAGSHTIKVDNNGVDWYEVSNYQFTNAVSAPPIDAYVLKSLDNRKAAGWLHNANYTHLNTSPSAVSGAILNVSGMSNGNYLVNFISCSTAAVSSSAMVAVTSGVLHANIPSVSWDLAFSADYQSAVPLDLLAFEGIEKPEGHQLSWRTVREKDVSHFDIEQNHDLGGRGTEGVFKKIGEVKAANSADGGNYQFLNAQVAIGISYYRLKIWNLDGTFFYSKTIALGSSGKTQIKIAPNPTLSDGIVTLELPVDAPQAQIFDLNGRLISTIKNVADNRVLFNTSDLPTGIYIVSAQTNGQVLTEKFVVSR